MCENEWTMSGKDASVCAISVLVPIYSTFCKKGDSFRHVWRCLNHAVHGPTTSTADQIVSRYYRQLVDSKRHSVKLPQAQ